MRLGNVAARNVCIILIVVTGMDLVVALIKVVWLRL